LPSHEAMAGRPDWIVERLDRIETWPPNEAEQQ
jgi:hypothetical protein